MIRVTKRVLTRKSVLGFGFASNRDLRVQELLNSGKQKALISAYFGLSKIDFTEDILDELCIPVEMRLNKPDKININLLKETTHSVLNLFYASVSEAEKIRAFHLAKKDNKLRFKSNSIRNSRQNIKSTLRENNQYK